VGQRQHSEQLPEGGHHWQLGAGPAPRRPRARARAGAIASESDIVDVGSMQCDFPVIKNIASWRCLLLLLSTGWFDGSVVGPRADRWRVRLPLQ
jgi:hypothetical protein